MKPNMFGQRFKIWGSCFSSRQLNTVTPTSGKLFESKNKKDFVKEWVQPEGFDTGIKVGNSYASLGTYTNRTLVPLIVKDPMNITWYSCGPTVYDDMHLGHACSYVRFDAIRRVLDKFFGFHVKLVMGITNVDDKIISRAQLLGKELLSMAQYYEMAFQKTLHELNVIPPFQYMRVSDFIPEMIAFINDLLTTGNAYHTGDGNVWFDCENFTKVGRLSQLHEEWEDSETGPNTKPQSKKSRRDFALWKAAKPGEPYWDAPWGMGRPAWHIECSTFGSLVFGSQMDIHSGGRDLCFPHHECELLQSEAYHGRSQWVNYFLHSGQFKLPGDTAKMSKSLGNTVTVPEFLSKWSSDHFRHFVLSSSYSTDKEYDARGLRETDTHLQTTKQFLHGLHKYVKGGQNFSVDSVELSRILDECRESMHKDFCNNFNIGAAMHRLRVAEGLVSKCFTDFVETSVREPDCVQTVLDFVEGCYEKLGFTTLTSSQGEQIPTSESQVDSSQMPNLINSSLQFRYNVRNLAKQAIKSQNEQEKGMAKQLLAFCDTIRNDFVKHGVKISDKVDGQTDWTLDDKKSS